MNKYKKIISKISTENCTCDSKVKTNNNKYVKIKKNI